MADHPAGELIGPSAPLAPKAGCDTRELDVAGAAAEVLAAELWTRSLEAATAPKLAEAEYVGCEYVGATRR